MQTKTKNRWKIRLISFYPPYLFSGISLAEVNDDVTRLVTQLKLRWYNKNLFGTHFGGSLYSMCDPMFLFIAVANLGNDYILWDKSACIRFKKPGKGVVKAIFEISPQKLLEMKNEVDKMGKMDFEFSTIITDEQGDVVAEVDKVIYARRKDFKFEKKH